MGDFWSVPKRDRVALWQGVCFCVVLGLLLGNLAVDIKRREGKVSPEEQQKPVEFSTGERFMPANFADSRFQYIMVDGHQYLVYYNSPHYFGMTHSPKCPCLKKEEEPKNE